MEEQLITTAGELGLPIVDSRHVLEYASTLDTLEKAIKTLSDMDGKIIRYTHMMPLTLWYRLPTSRRHNHLPAREAPFPRRSRQSIEQLGVEIPFSGNKTENRSAPRENRLSQG